MLCDESREVRSKAVDKIVSLGKINTSVECRKFEIPPLNFEASWWEIIPLQKISEPPLILKKTLMEIEEIRDKLLVVLLYPNHNQAVER